MQPGRPCRCASACVLYCARNFFCCTGMHGLAGLRATAIHGESMTLQEYKQGAENGNAHSGASKRKYQVGRVTLRTLFFDKHLLAALRSGARQVVLLGAGMDSRAWRLDLPPGDRGTLALALGLACIAIHIAMMLVSQNSPRKIAHAERVLLAG